MSIEYIAALTYDLLVKLIVLLIISIILELLEALYELRRKR